MPRFAVNDAVTSNNFGNRWPSKVNAYLGVVMIPRKDKTKNPLPEDQYELISLATSKPTPEFPEGYTYMTKRTQTGRYMSKRPLVPTDVVDLETGEMIHMDAVPGFDFIVHKGTGEKIWLRNIDLEERVVQDQIKYQLDNLPGGLQPDVDLSTVSKPKTK